MSNTWLKSYSARELCQLSSVLAAFLKGPNGWQEKRVLHFASQRLTGREVDVLSFCSSYCLM